MNARWTGIAAAALLACGQAAEAKAPPAGASEKGLFGIYGDTPDAKHAWAVHDMNRPYPRQVDTPAGKPPSDATVLFDGTQASVDANWCDGKGQPTKWTVKDGSFVCTPGSGCAFTRRSFGDAQLHVEWMAPLADDAAYGQLGGNSGVFPMGKYEIQILNSYDPDPKASVRRNYPDGIAGSAYAENPPLVNACRPAGRWQSYDIVFHQPIWKDGKVLHPGSVTVFQNGVLVQDHWELEGMSTHRRRRPLAEHATSLPWMLQDHSCPVPFRNIWIREIPSRWANTTHSVMAGVEADVMALRRETAAKVFALVDTDVADVRNVNLALETLQYATDAKYLAAAKGLAARYDAKIRALDAAGVKKAQSEIVGTLGGLNTLIRNGVVAEADFPLAKTLRGIADAHKWGYNK